MKIISEASKSVSNLLKRFLNTENCTRWLQYCVQTPIEDGVLVFNMLTREMIFLSQEEYDNFTEIDYLRANWFAVPENTKEKEIADFVKLVLSTRLPRMKEITGYTIFTTTDCNARCFYCFELGRSRVPMSCKTAESVVEYIKNHCGEKEVNISWFGGEPLFNLPVIEKICEGLRSNSVPFKSTMVSNGYLFDDLTVQKAVDDWNLRHVQITLDGTEKIYNKIKAYIYSNTNPYETVMNNIGKLLDAGIRVSIRLNMDMHNADNLIALTEELAQHFSGKKGLYVYAHHLFKGDIQNAQLHTEEEWQLRDKAMRRLNDSIERNGLASKGGISRNIKLNACMADCGHAVTILPDGSIGLCEHYSETEFIGHIDSEEFDANMVAGWKEKTPEIPECAECFYFLDCVKLKKCANDSSCYKLFRQERFRKTQQTMRNEYQKWLNKTTSEEDEEDVDC